MRLISAHIENFGNLHDFDYDFNDACNVIFEQNGWGKSTFAAFLRVMFFGLNNDRARGKDNLSRERVRYNPWQGGNFGGSLTFEVHGKEYVLSRFFGEKEALDTFELRDAKTNMISDDFSVNIGEEIFKINAESFAHSVFISQNDCITSTTDGINAKMGNIADNTGDIDSYEKAYNTLKKYLDHNDSKRATGLISKEKEKLSELNKEIIDNSQAEDSLKLYEDRIEKNTGLLKECRKEQDELRKLSDISSKQSKAKGVLDMHKKLEDDIDDLRGKLESEKAYFPKEVPSKDAVSNLLKLSREFQNADAAKGAVTMSSEDEENLSKLSVRFSDKLPTPGEIQNCEQSVIEYEKLIRLKNDNALSEAETERINVLSREFSENPVEEAEKIAVKNDRANSLKNHLTEVNNNIEIIKNKLKGYKSRLWLMVIPALLIVAAVIMSVLKLNTFSYIAFAAAFISGVLIIVSYKGSRKRKEYISLLNEYNNEAASINEEINEISSFVKEQYARHGYYEDENFVATYGKLMSSAKEYEKLLERKKVADGFEDYGNICTLQNDIRVFLKQYGYDASDEDFNCSVRNLLRDAATYERLLENRNKVSDYNKKQRDAKDELDKHFYELGFYDISNYSAMCDVMLQKVTLIDNMLADMDKLLRDKAVYEENNDIEALKEYASTEIALDSDEISNKLKELEAKADELTDMINADTLNAESLSEKCDRLDEARKERDELEEQIKKDKAKFELVKCALTELTHAKEDVTSEYMKPLLDNFLKYYSVVVGKAHDFKMDANTNLSIMVSGLQRDVSALSAGYRDLIGVCLRVAFIDAMYKNERPVIFMDDPFVNLDDFKIDGGKKLLEAISSRYQTIYFTCSKSRT